MSDVGIAVAYRGQHHQWCGTSLPESSGQADCDGEWGEISLDFENGAAEIIRLAAWDTMKANRFANKAIAYLLRCENGKLPKETMVVFER